MRSRTSPRPSTTTCDSSAQQAVPFTQVRFTTGFWAQRLTVNRERAIPANEHQCRTAGGDTGASTSGLTRIGAYAKAAAVWRERGPTTPMEPLLPAKEPWSCEPHPFWDSDVAKWIEAASYSLHTHPDAALESRIDAVIADMARAQLPDGYLNVHFTLLRPQERWTCYQDHELYCIGHLIEAGVAHHAATGKRSLLEICLRLADCVDRAFGPGPQQRHGYCGHQEIELALIKLTRATDDDRYQRLAQYMIDQRGTKPHYYEALKSEAPHHWIYRVEHGRHDYSQAHVPVRQQDRVTGHAVRAMYMYCAMTDLATHDAAMGAALDKLWQHVTSGLLYVTGGIGSSKANEGFTTDRDLPNETAYCETCASVGLIFWARRMHLRTGDGQYLDVLERTLYNAALAGMSLDGTKFFYDNPLASVGTHHRQQWFGCACCPPNISRLLASFGGYLASTAPGRLSLDLYAAGHIDARVDDQPVSLDVKTTYPWQGRIAVTVSPQQPQRFTLRLRIPAWCSGWSLRVNGRAMPTRSADGFASITRTWNPDDRVLLDLKMPVVRLHADPRVRQNADRTAVQRGPLVYCLESCDNGDDLDALILPQRARLRMKTATKTLAGMVMLHARGRRERPFIAGLYRTAPPTSAAAALTFVPYFAWDNRAPGGMQVWVRDGG